MNEAALIKNIDKHVGVFMELSLDEKIEKLLVQIKKVIPMLEQSMEETTSIGKKLTLEDLYKRYVRAEEILLHKNKEDIVKIRVEISPDEICDLGDYRYSSPLLNEIFKAELMYKEIWFIEILKKRNS